MYKFYLSKLYDFIFASEYALVSSLYLHLALDTVCMFGSAEVDSWLCFAGFLAVLVTVVEFFAHKFIWLYLAL